MPRRGFGKGANYSYHIRQWEIIGHRGIVTRLHRKMLIHLIMLGDKLT